MGKTKFFKLKKKQTNQPTNQQTEPEKETRKQRKTVCERERERE